MRWSFVLLCIVVFVVCDAGRVKREHKKHLNTHHNQHHEKSPKHHRQQDTRTHHNGHNRNPLHLRRVSGCNCAHGEVCVDGSATAKPVCVKKHFLKQGERLLREFKKHHPELQETSHKHHATPHIESPHDVQINIHAKHHDVKHPASKHHDTKHPNNKHHNEVNHRSDRILQSHQRSGFLNHQSHTKKATVCTTADFSDMRQRLTGWFRLLHAQEKEDHHNHHGAHHKKHRHLSVKKELRDHHDGKCKAQPSVMWEMHRLDIDNDHHLTSAELSEIENNSREPCLRPFLDSCDTNKDSQLSGHEWRCCFADAIAPCYGKLREIQRNTVLETAAYIPRCDREGYYEKEQCRGHTMETRTCWCVDLNGNEIPKTKSRVRAHCEKVDVLGHKKNH